MVTAECVTYLVLPRFVVFSNQLLNRRTATWDLFVLYNIEIKTNVNDIIHTSVLQLIVTKHQSKCEDFFTYLIKCSR